MININCFFSNTVYVFIGTLQLAPNCKKKKQKERSQLIDSARGKKREEEVLRSLWRKKKIFILTTQH